LGHESPNRVSVTAGAVLRSYASANGFVRQAVRLALATAAGSAAPLVALAQVAPAAENAPAPPLEEVVVTGSRLLQAPNDISISPIASVSSEQIEKTGLVRVEDVLNMLPQVQAEQSSGTSISSLGTATVSLRGLGSQRTLVLINGRRMQPGGSGGVPGPGSSSNSADIDQIPVELVERVDVLTGGASAVYGADAAAGVVNFVLNTHYQGVKIDAGYSYNNHKNSDQTYLDYLADFGATAEPHAVGPGRFELRRRQGQRDRLCHLPQQLPRGRLSVRPRWLHPERWRHTAQRHQVRRFIYERPRQLPAARCQCQGHEQHAAPPECG